MIVEHARGGAHDGFRIAFNIPGETQAWRKIIPVARQSLLHIDRILCGQYVARGEVDARQRIAKPNRRNLLRQLVVIAYSIVKGYIAPNLPRVLREPGHRFVANPADRITVALNEVNWESKTVLLYRSKVGRRGESRRTKLHHQCTASQAAKIKEARKVQLENSRRNIYRSVITAELEGVIPDQNIYVIGPFVPSFGANHGRE